MWNSYLNYLNSIKEYIIAQQNTGISACILIRYNFLETAH